MATMDDGSGAAEEKKHQKKTPDFLIWKDARMITAEWTRYCIVLNDVDNARMSMDESDVDDGNKPVTRNSGLHARGGDTATTMKLLKITLRKTRTEAHGKAKNAWDVGSPKNVARGKVYVKVVPVSGKPELILILPRLLSDWLLRNLTILIVYSLLFYV